MQITGTTRPLMPRDKHKESLIFTTLEQEGELKIKIWTDFYRNLMKHWEKTTTTKTCAFLNYKDKTNDLKIGSRKSRKEDAAAGNAKLCEECSLFSVSLFLFCVNWFILTLKFYYFFPISHFPFSVLRFTFGVWPIGITFVILSSIIVFNYLTI